MATTQEEGGRSGGGSNVEEADLQRLLNQTNEEEEALLEALRAKARLRKSARKGGVVPEGGEAARDGDEGASSGPKKEVRQPRDIFDVPVEDNFTKPLWIQLNTHDLLCFFNLMHHAVRKECTPTTCPKMTAGPNFEFLWSEGDNSKAITMCAPDYVATLNQWANDLTNGFNLDTQDEATFKRTYRLIWSRAFRIAMHIYWHHWSTITEMQLDGLLNAFTKHFVIFALKFRVLTSWDSISAIYDLLSSILPPLYASQLKDLRDGKKKNKPTRRTGAAGRRRAYTEFQERGERPPRLVDLASLPDATEELPLDEFPSRGSRSGSRAASPRESTSVESGSTGSGSSREDVEVKSQSSTPRSESTPLQPGCTLDGNEVESPALSSKTSTISPRSLETSPRDQEERRRKGSRIAMTKDDFIRELQRLKEQGQSGAATPNTSTSIPEERGSRGSRHGSDADLTEGVVRFFSPPDSPRREEPQSPRSPSSPSSRRSNTILQTSSSTPSTRAFPSIPPTFDVAKALADLTALEQEYDAFEELHELEQKLLSANEQKETSNEDIYAMVSPRKNTKRTGLISSEEFDEMRIQFQEQEKKRSRSWVAKRTSLPRNMQELKGTYIINRSPSSQQTSPRGS